MLMFLLSAATLFSAISSKCRAISLMLLALNFPQDLREFIWALLSLYFIVDNQHRCLTTRAYTATFFQRNVSIGCGLAQLNAQHLFGFFNELRNTSDVASCSQTKLDRIFATRLGLEEGIECDNTMDLTQGNIRSSFVWEQLATSLVFLN